MRRTTRRKEGGIVFMEGFIRWQTAADNSPFHWKRCRRKQGAFFYIGDESGHYIQIEKNGLLSIGTFEGAVPDISGATLSALATEQRRSFSDAFAIALSIGGEKLVSDAFGSE